MIADESKYVAGSRPALRTTPGNAVTTTEYPHAAVVPTATSVSMFVVPWRNARHAAR